MSVGVSAGIPDQRSETSVQLLSFRQKGVELKHFLGVLRQVSQVTCGKAIVCVFVCVCPCP